MPMSTACSPVLQGGSPRRRRALVVHTFHGHVFEGYFSPAMNRLVRWTERRLAGVTPMRCYLVAVRHDVPVACRMDAVAAIPDRSVRPCVPTMQPMRVPVPAVPSADRTHRERDQADGSSEDKTEDEHALKRVHGPTPPTRNLYFEAYHSSGETSINLQLFRPTWPVSLQTFRPYARL